MSFALSVVYDVSHIEETGLNDNSMPVEVHISLRHKLLFMLDDVVSQEELEAAGLGE
jgi:hypothetical protein